MFIPMVSCTAYGFSFLDYKRIWFDSSYSDEADLEETNSAFVTAAVSVRGKGSYPIEMLKTDSVIAPNHNVNEILWLF